jgi:hypothetical protein
MTCGGSHLGFPIGIKNTHLVEDLPMIIPGQFGFNYPSGFREEAWFMAFYTSFNNISVISWWSVLLVEERGENQRYVASH